MYCDYSSWQDHSPEMICANNTCCFSHVPKTVTTATCGLNTKRVALHWKYTFLYYWIACAATTVELQHQRLPATMQYISLEERKRMISPVLVAGRANHHRWDHPLACHLHCEPKRHAIICGHRLYFKELELNDNWEYKRYQADFKCF